MSKPQPDDAIELRIDLPLPSDIAATLIQVVGLTYPRTQIANDGHTWKHERQLVLVIDPKDRHKSAKSKKKYEKTREWLSEDSAFVPWVGELGPNGVGVGAHEALAKWWVNMARDSFKDQPVSVNYLESDLYDDETHQHYVFYVAKGKDRTPHALRKEAERRVAELEAELDAAADLVQKLTAQAESDEQRLAAAGMEIAELTLQLEEKESSSSITQRTTSGSARRSAKSSAATKSAGSGGTRKAGRSSSPGPRRGTSSDQ